METIIKSIDDLKVRPSWNEYFTVIAYLISKRSTCDRLHVGCVITKNNRIISTGYNGNIPGAPHESIVVEGHEQLTIHAEANAIADAAKRGASLNNTVAYITHFPCINCCKILISAGIEKIIYINEYKINDLVYKLCKDGNVEIVKMNLIKNQ